MTFLKMKKSNGSSTRGSTGVDGGPSGEASKPKPRLGAPPDGGFGWVVAFSSFSISLLVDGVCFSFGIFFEDFRSEFKTTKATTSWIGSVLNGSYLIFGPLVSALVNIYGCRRVAMCGSVLASVAFFISSYTHNIGLLIFTFGFLGGVGFGLMYLPAIVIVGYYFERRRALATGIACCGSGIGAFLFAPFAEYLLNEYGWRGATWIISGLVLNGFVFALFYRPLPGPIVERVVSSDTLAGQPDSLAADTEASGGAPEWTPLVQHQHTAGVSGKNKETPMKQSQSAGAGAGKLGLESFLRQDNSGGLQIYRCRSVTLSGPDQITDTDRSFRETEVLRMTKSHDAICMAEIAAKKASPPQPQKLNLPALQRKDIFYSGSLWNLKAYQDVGSMEEFRQEMIGVRHSPSGHPGGENATDWEATATTVVTTPTMREALSSLFDLELMKSPTFLIYGTSCCLCMLGFFVPFIYMPVHSMDLGLDARSAAFLISIIGITNTVGRVAVGFISDQPWADCLLINNIALMSGGIITIFVPLFTHYYVLAIYAALFGTAIAVFVSLRSIIMVELMGIEKLTTAFGFVIMFQGMSSFLGAPAAGALSDYTGNYNASFYMAGISLFLSGVICIPLRRVAHWENQRYKNTTTTTTTTTDTTTTTKQIAPSNSSRNLSSSNCHPIGDNVKVPDCGEEDNGMDAEETLLNETDTAFTKPPAILISAEV